MTAFFEGLYQQFYITFVYENRWKFFLDGLWMTLVLTFLSFMRYSSYALRNPCRNDYAENHENSFLRRA